MPYVNIKVTDDGVTIEHKRQLIAGVTQLLKNVLNKDPALTHVVIDLVDKDRWGVAGRPVSEDSLQQK